MESSQCCCMIAKQIMAILWEGQVMVNIRLKKIIMEIVENQLRENDPPVTRQAYQRLLDSGYSVREAKEKIGAVVLTEIYDVLKANQSYDEMRYRLALEEMVQQSIDFEDIHSISTEWYGLVQQGYEAQEKRVDAWLQDPEMELGNWGEHEKRLDFCRAVLDMLDWTFDDSSNYRSAIGEELYASGKAAGRCGSCIPPDTKRSNWYSLYHI